MDRPAEGSDSARTRTQAKLARGARASIEESLLSRALVDAMADGVVVARVDGEIVFATPRATELTGYPADELVGQNVDMLVPGTLRGAHAANRQHYAQAPVPRSMGTDLMITLRRRDGSERPVDIALSPLESGGETLVIASIRDVSRRRAAERRVHQQAQLLDSAHDSIVVRQLDDDRITFWNQGAIETYGYSREEAIGSSEPELLRTIFPEPMARIRQALIRRGRWEGELTHHRRDGTWLVVSSRWLLASGQQGSAQSVLEINREMTTQHRARQRLEAVLAVTRAILAGEASDVVLELITHQARDLVGAALATLARPEAETGALVVRVAEGEGGESLLDLQLPPEGSFTARTHADRRPVRIDDLSSDRRGFRLFARAASLGPALYVPLLSEDRLLGTLMVANPIGSPPFSDDELTVVQLFGDAAAVALAYGEARDVISRTMLVDDRERIARELHDGVVQTLFGVGMGLQSAAALVQEPKLQQRLQQAVDRIDGVMRDIRAYIFELRPDLLGGRLERSIRQLAEEVRSEVGVDVTVTVAPAAMEAANARAEDLVQIAREALSNVRRHAFATTCSLRLERDGHTIVLVVEDNGVGFDQTLGDRGAGQGLGNLAARARRLGGHLDLRSAPGEGTVVRVTVPIP